MALTLECFCEDDPSVSICTLDALTLMVTIEHPVQFTEFQLLGGPEDIFVSTEGKSETDLSPVQDWIDNWEAMTANLIAERTTLEVNVVETVTVTYLIRATYNCRRFGSDTIVGTYYEYYTSGTDGSHDAKCECRISGTLNAYGWAGDGLLGEQIMTTGPLHDCNGCTVTVPWLGPAPTNTKRMDPNTSGQICLCVDGGTPPYKFYSSDLPLGQSLDADGCVVGVPTASPRAGGETTFTVVDLGGQTASVVCNIRRGCFCDENEGNLFI